MIRVPSYSPYTVVEHAMALLLLTSIRRIHKAYIRTKDLNFRLEGLTGFDLHSKTVGVIGTGKIRRIFIDICRRFGMNVIVTRLGFTCGPRQGILIYEVSMAVIRTYIHYL